MGQKNDVIEVEHSRIQHGVGQGSFHSATLKVEVPGEDGHRFDYVYDCGSGSSRVLNRCIKRMDLEARSDSGGQPVLDALVLSHYDLDHLSGARSLAKSCAISRIYVPYLSPDELALVIASQAAQQWDQGVLRELHALANGDSELFGIPVTQIQEGGPESESPAGGRPESEPEDERSVRPPVGDEHGPPSRMRIVVGGSRHSPKSEMSDNQELLVLPDFSQGRAVWRLKFWNRGLSDDLANLVRQELEGCGFPLDKLGSQDGVQDVIDWLGNADNRRGALKAYRSAIKQHEPDWAKESDGHKLSNFLSLCMYAGPAAASSRVFRRRVFSGTFSSFSPTLTCRLFGPECDLVDRAGWLGTGDAPLGEADVWKDFEQHFFRELGQTLTVLVPHHGSAPIKGPRFFNSELARDSDTVFVISCGKNNGYGHPKASVVRKILAAGGELHIVNEDWPAGLHEYLTFQTSDERYRGIGKEAKLAVAESCAVVDGSCKG